MIVKYLIWGQYKTIYWDPMGKRDRNHDSREDSKSPLPSKRVNPNKQTNLDKFFNVSANSSL